MYSLRYIVAKMLRRAWNPPAVNHSELDQTARCDVGCSVNYSTIGRYTYLGQNTSLSYANVGAFTSISSNCAIGGGGHPMNWVAMSPVFQDIGMGRMKKKFGRNAYDTHEQTRIGNDVWIGAGCFIKSGITIADGAVIGMGSVVTHNVGPYEVWAGNPARMIRKRFDDDTIGKLCSVAWWNWSEERLAEQGDLFDRVDVFLDRQQSAAEPAAPVI